MPAARRKQLAKRRVYYYVVSPLITLFNEGGTKNINLTKALQEECLHSLAGYKT